ncbi:MAG TPA: mannose-1-phosphate guanylyltransferase/mannose-6-phosphate isomerase [Burkholderiaceae bacterium]|nr:mannose-1-phosphate guanylyltransferase/mannose-6-phosphate isomerase [Burkholderiaceae bacterium]
MLAVILSGGSGTRLWPVSREAMPKPFMRIGNGPSLLQRTVSRAVAAGARDALIVTNREYGFRTLEELERVRDNRPASSHVLLEPIGRNTAPAIAAAALWAKRAGRENDPLLVLPADHLIQDEARFAAMAKQAGKLATLGNIVLFGIRPTMPETGFGYIECDAAPSGDTAVAVKRFVEKPDAATAAEYVAAGRYLWNSGMFCFTPATILAALGRLAPAVLDATAKALPAVASQSDRTELDKTAFQQSPDISIDYAVMEKASGVLVLAGDFGWSDIGSWKAVAEEHDADAAGNSVSGEVILADCSNTHVQSEDRLIAAVGLRGIVIVDTPDALLVCDRNATQKVKDVVGELKRRGHEAHKLHRTVERPWGTYTTLQEGPRFKIKRIEVKPGASLSLQMHHHRSEHWIVVSGTAKVSIDGKEALVSPNESTYVPVGAKHRLENPGKVLLTMIEVQSGDYVGEDDIVRFEDKYGRVA